MLGHFLSDSKRHRWLQKVYRWARRSHGWSNTTIVRARMHKVRPPISAAFDTVVAQICKVERGAWYSIDRVNWGVGAEAKFYGPTETPFNEEHRNEVPFVNAICEMARRSDIVLYLIPTVEDEKKKNRSRHSDHFGCVNVDHGVAYRDLGLECPRMKFTLSRMCGLQPLSEVEDCSMEIGRHHLMLEYFSGKKQIRDAWHLMLCDSFGIEIFFTCDGRFLRRYEQVQEKLRNSGLRTRVMRPSDFCRDLGIAAIPIAPSDPYGAMRGTIR